MNVEVLRNTLERTLAQDDRFPRTFYDRLFTDHPEVRALFKRNTPGAMHKMFAQKLTSLIDHVEDPDWLNRELPSLAANHAAYGVTAEMYPWVGDALISTLREACGDAWSDEAERSWREAYASLMAAILG